MPLITASGDELSIHPRTNLYCENVQHQQMWPVHGFGPAPASATFHEFTCIYQHDTIGTGVLITTVADRYLV